jgi:hypothetical protein
MRTPSPVSAVFVALVLSSCTRGEQQAARSRAPTQLPVLALSQKPTLEIGVMEGDAHYTFQSIVGVVPLSSGDLVVSDGGSAEITLYAPDGTFVRRWGGRGEGPGEFRVLAGAYAGPGDSIMGEDGVTARVSVFDSTGDFARQLDGLQLSGDSVFRLDAWLYGRFWVDGAPRADARARVKELLDHLPQPASAPGYRVVRVAADGGLWIREPEAKPDGTRTWTVLTAGGEPRAIFEVPGRFEPLYFGKSRVLGLWLGESDVNFVRAYDVEDTGRKARTPDWLRVPSDTTTVPPVDEKEVRAEIVMAVKTMASAQEIHYATSSTYTTNLDSLNWERPKDVMVDFVHADSRGWAAVFTRPGFDRLCGLAYGADAPAGWTPGRILCGPPAASASTPQGS